MTDPALLPPAQSRPTPAPPRSRASGKSLLVTHRRVKNQRLATAGYQWAFAALTASPGAAGHYQRRRAAGDAHPAALRNLFNRLLGCLHHCLQTQQPYQEHTAFAPPRRQHRPAPA
jgi:hypothetical protein